MGNNQLYNEKELLTALSKESREAFTTLYMRFYPSLYRYLLVVTRSKEVSEEVIQDIFLKVWIKRHTLAGIQSFENYVFTMAKNRLFDVRKGIMIQQQALRQLPAKEAGNTIYQDVLFKEYEQLAVKAIDQLPEKRRQIFFMNARDELTAREIAEIMDMSLASVKKHLYEASHFIRKYLQRYGKLAVLLFFFIFYK